MENEFNSSVDKNYTPSLPQLELLEQLLAPDNAPYPWDITDPEAELYLSDKEQDFLLESLSESEIAAHRQSFFAQIEQIWSTTSRVSLSTPEQMTDILVRLQQQFTVCLPQNWLNAIAHKAYQVIGSNNSTADKLVQCVQELLPNWAEDDLLVLARPFAYAMRGTESDPIAAVEANLRSQNWQALSEIEQARLSLAIAQFTLNQLQHNQRVQDSGSTDQG